MRRLGTVVALHASRRRGNGALDDRSHSGHPRALRSDRGPLSYRGTQDLLQGTHRADIPTALLQDQFYCRCGNRQAKDGVGILAGARANRCDGGRKAWQRDDLQTPGSVGSASEMISTATYAGQHPTSTCPKTAAFYPCPQNMSIAWTYRPPSVHFLAEFGHVCRGRDPHGAGFLLISQPRRQKPSNKSRNFAFTPVPRALRRRYYLHSKPGGPLSQDTHTSSGLSFYGLGVGT